MLCNITLMVKGFLFEKNVSFDFVVKYRPQTIFQNPMTCEMLFISLHLILGGLEQCLFNETVCSGDTAVVSTHRLTTQSTPWEGRSMMDKLISEVPKSPMSNSSLGCVCWGGGILCQLKSMIHENFQWGRVASPTQNTPNSMGFWQHPPPTTRSRLAS